MLTPSIGFCCDAVHDLRLVDAGRFQDGRRDVNDVMELGPQLALGLDCLWPMDDQRVARAAEVRGDLLGPLERRVRRPGPADRHVRLGGRAADLVELRLPALPARAGCRSDWRSR